MYGRLATKDPSEVIRRDIERYFRLTSPRRVEVVNMSLARDVGSALIGMVPVVGGQLADLYGDNVWANMKRRLTDQEEARFTDVTRRYPDTIALLQTFQSVD